MPLCGNSNRISIFALWKEGVRFASRNNALREGTLRQRGESTGQRGQILGRTGEVLEIRAKFRLEVVMHVKPFVLTCSAFLLYIEPTFGRIYQEIYPLRCGSSISPRCFSRFCLILHPYFDASTGWG